MLRTERRQLVNAFRRAAVLSLFGSACSNSANADTPDVIVAIDATNPTDTGATVVVDSTVPGDTLDAPETNVAETANEAGDETTDEVLDAGDDAFVDETTEAGDETDEAGDPYATGPCARSVADSGAETNDLCSRFWTLPCGIPPTATILSDCTIKSSDCNTLCNYPAPSCRVIGDACLDGGTIAETGPVDLFCDVCLVGGRRPERLVQGERCAPRRDVGGYFAALAHLEAASVPAFRRMVGELRALGAPRALVVAASSAARDEARHARTTTRLARRFGAQPRAPRVGVVRRRSLEALALDNEIEGCVRETFAACLMQVQASRAADADVRRQLAHIAVDETNHSALSWAIARWVRTKLPQEARARLDRARAEEIDRLQAGLGDVDATIARAVGLPDTAAQRRLVDGLRSELWSA